MGSPEGFQDTFELALNLPSWTELGIRVHLEWRYIFQTRKLKTDKFPQLVQETLSQSSLWSNSGSARGMPEYSSITEGDVVKTKDWKFWRLNIFQNDKPQSSGSGALPHPLQQNRSPYLRIHLAAVASSYSNSCGLDCTDRRVTGSC